jgi:hypothetical protein
VPRIQLRNEVTDLDDHGWVTADGGKPSPKLVAKAQESFLNRLHSDDDLGLPEQEPLVLFGEVQMQGFLIKFSASMLDRMPPHVASHVIAHELMHVVLMASPTHGEMPTNELEDLVDEMVSSAGFGERAMFTR